jgi:P27 family predicted phage terminase small subunit
VAKKGPAPQSRRQRANSPVGLVVLAGGQLEVPKPPAGWLKQTKDDWADFYSSPQAGAVDSAGQATLRRLFDLRDEVERIRRGIKKTGPMVEGSQGQPVVNPAYRVLTALLSEIRQLEDRFSMNPQAAVKLGFAGSGGA